MDSAFASVNLGTPRFRSTQQRMVRRGVVGHGLAGPGMLLSLKGAKENPDHHRRPSTGGLLFCPLESPGASPRCPLGLAGLPKRRNSGTGEREWPFLRIIRQLRGNDTALLPCRDGYGIRGIP